MQKIVTNLLMLARCHSGQLQPGKKKIELTPLVSSVWKEYADRASARGITVQFDVPQDLVIAKDKDLFETILHNLFSNAVSYAAAPGKIDVRSDIQNDTFSFSISNSVKDLSENDVPLMFEPFWQKDEARTPGDDHSGLGLALVRSLAEVLGLTVNAHLTTPASLTITLAGKTNQSA
jgi:signal transduction histidine kinase